MNTNPQFQNLNDKRKTQIQFGLRYATYKTNISQCLRLHPPRIPRITGSPTVPAHSFEYLYHQWIRDSTACLPLICIWLTLENRIPHIEIQLIWKPSLSFSPMSCPWAVLVCPDVSWGVLRCPVSSKLYFWQGLRAEEVSAGRSEVAGVSCD